MRLLIIWFSNPSEYWVQIVLLFILIFVGVLALNIYLARLQK